MKEASGQKTVHVEDGDSQWVQFPSGDGSL